MKPQKTTAFDGPALRFNSTKKILGLRPIAFNHAILPFEKLPPSIKKKISPFFHLNHDLNSTSIIAQTTKSAATIPHKPITSTIIGTTHKILEIAGNYLQFRKNRELIAKTLPALMQKKSFREAALHLEGKKYALNPQKQDKLLQMTHFSIDDEGNLIFLEPPNQKELWKRFLWLQPIRRKRIKLPAPAKNY